MGDLGTTHYFTLVFRTSSQNRPERPRLAKSSDDSFGNASDDKMEKESRHGYENIFDILEPDERKAAQ